MTSLAMLVLASLLLMTSFYFLLSPVQSAAVCLSIPCANGGHLRMSNSIWGRCRCMCRPGFVGPYCQYMLQHHPNHDVIQRQTKPSNKVIQRQTKPSNKEIQRQTKPSNKVIQRQTNPSNKVIQRQTDPILKAIQRHQHKQAHYTHMNADGHLHRHTHYRHKNAHGHLHRHTHYTHKKAHGHHHRYIRQMHRLVYRLKQSHGW